MKKLLTITLLAAVGFGVMGCSTTDRKDDTVMVPVFEDTIVECRNFTGPGNNNSDDIHRDPVRMSYSDCQHVNGDPGFYPY